MKTLDIINGLVTSFSREVIEKHNFIAVNVPGNITKYCQVLDMTVKKYAKAFTRKEHYEVPPGLRHDSQEIREGFYKTKMFNEWYAK